jgi:hypothetical protein
MSLPDIIEFWHIPSTIVDSLLVILYIIEEVVLSMIRQPSFEKCNSFFQSADIPVMFSI